MLGQHSGGEAVADSQIRGDLSLFLSDGWDAEICLACFLWRCCHVWLHSSLAGRKPHEISVALVGFIAKASGWDFHATNRSRLVSSRKRPPI